MIEVEATAEGAVVRSVGLEAGSAVYFDADWIAEGASAAVPTLVVDMSARDADGVAGAALVRLAERAAAGVGNSESAIVLGSGTVARHVRRLLAARGIQPPEEGPPPAIVEATGNLGSVADALAQAATLGTIVLVGEPRARTASLDLYSDLHVRGLTLVGIARPTLASAEEAAGLPEAVRAELAHLVPGGPLPAGAGWYRLTA